MVPAINHSRLQHSCLDMTSASVSHRFEKIDLCQAQVINQVDKKFIACIVEQPMDASRRANPSSSSEHISHFGPTLVLIDQHAAHERVRVEKYLKDLCTGFLHNKDNTEDSMGEVQIRELSPPLPVLLTLHEAQRLEGSVEIQQAFHQWGFRFANLSNREPSRLVLCGDGSDAYTQVMVQSVPEVVGEKVRLFYLCFSS